MAEALGIVASVAAVVGIAKTCIDLLAVIDDCRYLSRDQEHVISQLKEQRLRFFLWCDYVQIAEFLQWEEREGATATSALATTFMGNAPGGSTPLHRHFVLDTVRSILQRMARDFKRSGELLETYTTQSRGINTRHIVRSISNNHVYYGFTDYFLRSEHRIRRQPGARKTAMSVLQAGKWTLSDKRRLTELIRSLRQANDGLQSLLGLLELARFRRREQLLATMNATVGTDTSARGTNEITLEQTQNGRMTQDVEDPGGLLIPDNEDLPRLIQLYRESQRLDENSVPVTQTSSDIAPSPSFSLFADENHLSPSEITLSNTIDMYPQKRQIGVFASRPVIVEWKYRSARPDPCRLNLLKQRVSMLVSQLRRSSQTANFNTGNCAGYFDDPGKQRIGIVFDYPSGQTSNRVVTLKERMIEDRVHKRVKSLTSRIRVAKSLALTVYMLHSVQWLHKSLRADNVVFFESSDCDVYSMSTPHLFGFDFSRRDAPSELTEELPSVVATVIDQEMSLYRHPDLDDPDCALPSSTETEQDLIDQARIMAEFRAKHRFCKAYDVYSLGVILLELGLWTPLRSLFKRRDSLEENRKQLLGPLLLELRYRMGDIYYDVVRRCLHGDFDSANAQNAGELETVGDDPDPDLDAQEDARIWLAGFDELVVSQLEKCRV